MIGGAIIFFGIVVPERLGMSLEFCVALMLILLGALNCGRLFARWKMSVPIRQWHPQHVIGMAIMCTVTPTDTTRHPRSRGGSGPAGELDRWFGRSKFYQTLRPIVIGTVHGLAGSAAVALLVLPIIHDPIWAMAYCLSLASARSPA